jgi:hypothetical protein
LDIIVGRAVDFARRSVLLFSPGLSLYGITSVAFLFIVEDDARLRILRYGPLRARYGAWRLDTMFANVHTPHEIELAVYDLRPIPPDRYVFNGVSTLWIIGPVRRRIVFLFAGDLAGLASPTGIFFENQFVILHDRPPCRFSG